MKFVRSTHIDREYRGDDVFLPTNMEWLGLGPHALLPNNPMSLQEYLNYHKQYAEWYPNDFSLPSDGRLELELKEMVRIGLVKELV